MLCSSHTDNLFPCPIAGRTLGNCYPAGSVSVNVRDDNGRSQYDSLQVQLERVIKRLAYIAAYTFSKTKDNGEGSFDADQMATPIISTFMEPHGSIFRTILIRSIYDLPFGRAGPTAEIFRVLPTR